MKTLKYIYLIAFILTFSGCEKKAELYDFERYKFVSFVEQEITVGENYSAESESAYPIYLRYDGSTLDEEFTVELKVTGNNIQEGQDYSVETTTVVFKAGEVKSEPFFLNIIDNLIDNELDGELTIEIVSVSNPNIDIGVGIVNQSNKSLSVTILDNECSEDIDIFNATLSNQTPWDTHTITGTLDGSVVTLVGDLISYSAFSNATLAVTLTPLAEGAKIGTATFEDYNAGADSDGYEYQFRQVGEGTYDVCAGEIKIEFEVYWLNGSSWSYWYTTSNIITIQ